jgi:hypothetical protein
MLPGFAGPNVAFRLIGIISTIIVKVTHIEGQGAVTVLALELPWWTFLFSCKKVVQ